MFAPAWITPTGIAIAAVGTVAVAALIISVWQLARSDAVQLTGASVLAPTGPATTAGVSGAVQSADATRGTPLAAGTFATTIPVTEAQQVAGAKPSPAARTKASAAHLVVTAARGDCWLEVRAGSARGKLLFAGTLEQGRSLRFVRGRLWLAFGAGGNLDVTLNGERVESFPTGTATAVVTAKSVQAPASG